MANKYKIGDIIKRTYNVSSNRKEISLFIEFGHIWAIKEDSYIIKWLGREELNDLKWGAWEKIIEVDTCTLYSISSYNEYILFGNNY